MHMNNNNLKILLMLGWSEYFLGCETHTYSMTKELIKLGHEVHIFTYLKGKMWERMKETGAILLEDKIENEYDLAIINNNGCLIKAPKSAYKIFISNGVIPTNEHPVPGADRYVAVSEETHVNLLNKGYYDSIVVRNGIDCERFSSIKPINKKLKNVLLLSNKQSPYTNEFLVIDEACRKMNINLMVCGLQFGTSVWETEEFINKADLVISLGRGVYESMACERNVIIADYNGMDGFVDKNTYIESRKNNCSGRRFGNQITIDSITKELKKYNIKQGKKNRNLILQNNDIKKIIENYLSLNYFGKVRKNLNI